MRFLFISALIYSVFVTPVLGFVLTDNLKVFEKLPEIPTGWKQGIRASPATELHFSLALKQSRVNELEQHVINIATPGHTLYGQHLTGDEVSDYVRPSQQGLNSVTMWLQSVGVENAMQEGNWIKFTANVSQAERMFNTEYYRFTNNHRTLVRTLRYSVPSTLHDTILLIQPTTRLSGIKTHFHSVQNTKNFVEPNPPPGFNARNCNLTVTPDCLRALYKIDNFTATSVVGNKLGISGYLDEYARYSDLSQFLSTFAPYAVKNNFTVELINNGSNVQDSSLDSGEANLDIQYSLSLASNTPVTYYSTSGRGLLNPDLDQPDQEDNQNEPYLEQLQYLLSLSDEDLPSVLSTSYGEDEQSVPASYANVTCNLFAQLGARGVSVILSSGDTGVGSACQTNDGRNTTRFMPVFPASCPFVTSVGGTQNIQPESAATYSAGGFSDLFARPEYQDAAVCTYLEQLGDQWEGLYNPYGRAFPDVSAQSYNFQVYDQNALKKYWGTSCAAPVFAAIIANMNSIRMAAGLPSLGFLNPFLYKYGRQGLTDITTGGSMGCTGYDQSSGLETPLIPYASWNATVGWDPVTGLGTPVFPKLVELMVRYAVPGNYSRRVSRRRL